MKRLIMKRFKRIAEEKTYKFKSNEEQDIFWWFDGGFSAGHRL